MEQEFYDDNGHQSDFLIAPDIADIGRKLIKAYPDDFGDIKSAEIDYFWKRKGGTHGGRDVLGKLQKPTGILEFYSKRNFIMFLGADNCMLLNHFQITALVFHELKHAGWDPEKGYEVLSHDFEGFEREVEIFGHWKNDIKRMARAFKAVDQPGLFGGMELAK
jgi:hypothetical protein